MRMVARLVVAVGVLGAAASVGADDSAAFRAGFAEVDITPPPGTPRQGWNTKLVGDSARDPIMVRAAVFERGGRTLALIQLDIALVTAADTATIRRRVEAEHMIPGDRVMVAATHTHSGPAVIDEALPRDETWIAKMVAGSSKAVGLALAAREDAEVAVGRAFEWGVAFNRRVVMRDGTVRTHGSFKDANALAFEGPIDPEVGVLAVRSTGGPIRGILVNFASHPTHHGGDSFFSAGYPGAIARELKARGIPVTLFLQGAAGNISYDDPRGTPPRSMDEMGSILALDALKAIDGATWTKPSTLDAASTTVPIPYRQATQADIQGKAPGTQRFGEPGYYERQIPGLLEAIRRNPVEPAEVQVFRIGDVALATQPSESFVEHGLRIKESTWPVRTFVVGYANGMLGYLPHEAAFPRGGYECTFGPPSRMAPEAGRLLADAAIGLVKRLMEPTIVGPSH